MTLDDINLLLSNNELNNKFPDEIFLLTKRIAYNEISALNISETFYPAKHFLEICLSQLDLIRKEQGAEPSGLKKTTQLLGQFSGAIRIGYLITRKKEKFVLYFQKDLKCIIAIYYDKYVRPIVLDSSGSIKPAP